MGFFSKDIKTMDDLFVHTLRDIYYAEKQIVQSLPEMIEKASDPQLKQNFQAHLGETKNHVMRVEQVFRLHGKEPKMVDCPAIDGIIDEAEDVAFADAERERIDGHHGAVILCQIDDFDPAAHRWMIRAPKRLVSDWQVAGWQSS